MKNGRQEANVGNGLNQGVEEVVSELQRAYGDNAWKVADQQLALAQDVEMINRWREIANHLAQ